MYISVTQYSKFNKNWLYLYRYWIYSWIFQEGSAELYSGSEGSILIMANTTNIQISEI